MYFQNCHTPDQIRERYRTLAKMLHPDMGGNAADFRTIQGEYEQAKKDVENNKTRSSLPTIFNESGRYEYYRRSVKYVGIHYNHYYKFIQNIGSDILIDLDHVRLIFDVKILG